MRTGGGKAAVDFDPQGTQFVALRWTPAEKNSRKGFELAEVSAFGDMPLSMLSTSELPDSLRRQFDGSDEPSPRHAAAEASAGQPVGVSAFTIALTTLRDRFRRLAEIVQA